MLSLRDKNPKRTKILVTVLKKLRLCKCRENHIELKKGTDKKRTIKKKICSGHKKKFMGIYNCRLAQIWRYNFLSRAVP